MSRIYYLIEIYHKINGPALGTYTYETTPSVTIRDGLALDNDKSIEATSDSFSFRLFNQRDNNGLFIYSENIKVDDRVIIYLTSVEEITDSNKASYRKFDGTIKEIQYEVSSGGRELFIKGESRLSRLLNFTYPASYKPTSTFTSTASEIVKSLITTVNDDNTNYGIEWDTNNDSTTEPIQYCGNYRPVIEMITELSTQKINTEFNAYFYLSTENKFIWKQKNKETNTFLLEEGKDFTVMKIQEKVWEVMNAMIVDCGKDPKGNSTHTLYYDETSAGEYGLKWANTIEPKNEICADIIAAEKGQTGVWIENTDVTKTNFPNSYPITLTIEDRDNEGKLTGTRVTVSNDAEWVLAVRKEAKRQGANWIKQVIDLTGHVRPKIDITMQGANWELGAGRTGTSTENCLDSSGNPIVQGDFIEIKTLSTAGSFQTGQKMRVIQINHEVSSKGGWQVSMRLEVDVDDAVDYKSTTHT